MRQQAKTIGRGFLLALLLGSLLLVAMDATGAAAAPLFSAVPGEMGAERYEAAVLALPDGNVLIAGGTGPSIFYKTAELYDPTTGTLETLGAAHEMVEGVDEAASTTLPSGDGLIIGGVSETETLASIESFDPASDTFEKLKEELTEARDGGAAVLLPSGKVLVVGGYDKSNTVEGGELRTAEVLDPGTETVSKVTAEMSVGRYEPAAGLLPDGKVLIAGGYSADDSDLKTAEVFDPKSETFEKLPAEMTVAREELAHTTLADGELLLAGGYNHTENTLSSAEVFNPQTGTFQALASSMTARRDGPGAVLLPGGRVLVAAGVREDKEAPLLSLETLSFPPAATTASSSAVTETGATVSGSSLNEIAGSAYFQYGTTAAYGSSSALQREPAAIDPQTVAAQLAGLAAGTLYHYRLVVVNGSGTSYGADATLTTLPKPAPPPPVAPRVTGLRQSHATWREGKHLAKISRRTVPVGTVFSLTLNEAASVKLTFRQQLKGRKLGRRCLAQTRSNRRHHACKRQSVKGSLTLAGHGGLEKIGFQGKLASRRLPPGRYVATVIATNGAGQQSRPVLISFTIVR